MINTIARPWSRFLANARDGAKLETTRVCIDLKAQHDSEVSGLYFTEKTTHH